MRYTVYGMPPPRRSRFPGLEGPVDRRRELIEELVRLRQESELSQTDVAARMGTSQSAVARLESGGLDARLSTLERYAAALGRTVDWQVRPTARSSAPSEESR
jgi:transcriptional regulator with XRE-family HTH domain